MSLPFKTSFCPQLYSRCSGIRSILLCYFKFHPSWFRHYGVVEPQSYLQSFVKTVLFNISWIYSQTFIQLLVGLYSIIIHFQDVVKQIPLFTISLNLISRTVYNHNTYRSVQNCKLKSSVVYTDFSALKSKQNSQRSKRWAHSKTLTQKHAHFHSTPSTHESQNKTISGLYSETVLKRESTTQV